MKHSIREHGDFIYITSPVGVYEPEQQEIEAFAFAVDVRKAAPNPKFLWMRGQYVEAENANRNGDAWTEGELTIKALTPVLCPVTVMHDLRSAVGTIADARLLTPAADNVPRARIDTTLAIWAHRFPEVAEECLVNAKQGTLMESMECLSPFYSCTECGVSMQRHQAWQDEWKAHVATHTEALSEGRSLHRILERVTFTGVGLIFGTRGARGAMPSAHLEVEELAAMHREAHSGKTRRPRRPGKVEIEDSKYEELVSAKSKAEGTVITLTAAVADKDKQIETLETAKVKAEEERDTARAEAEAAKETSRVAAMRDDRMSALGTGFRAKLEKLETTAKNVLAQAAKLADEEWEARLVELEESLGVKRDAKLEADPAKPADTTAGLLFDRKTVASSAVGTTPEVVAADQEPSLERRQSVIGGLIRKKEPAKA